VHEHRRAYLFSCLKLYPRVWFVTWFAHFDLLQSTTLRELAR
jgi:hypothetical protein